MIKESYNLELRNCICIFHHHPLPQKHPTRGRHSGQRGTAVAVPISRKLKEKVSIWEKNRLFDSNFETFLCFTVPKVPENVRHCTPLAIQWTNNILWALYNILWDACCSNNSSRTSACQSSHMLFLHNKLFIIFDLSDRYYVKMCVMQFTVYAISNLMHKILFHWNLTYLAQSKWCQFHLTNVKRIEISFDGTLMAQNISCGVQI